VGCCGKAGNIVKGNVMAAVGTQTESGMGRLFTCLACDEHTWMATTEYAKWLLSHGIEVVTHFTELETLPKLPKYPKDKKRRHPFCRLCKCSLRAKTVIEDEECLLGKWSKPNRLLENPDTG
jgi:hypothetical protein